MINAQNQNISLQEYFLRKVDIKILIIRNDDEILNYSSITVSFKFLAIK